MYKVEKTQYGVKIVFSGLISENEMKQWFEESKKLSLPSEFGVIVDMRELKPLAKEAQHYLEEGQKYYQSKGMKRSSVIVSSAIVKMQFQRLAKETGIYQFERYIEPSQPNFEIVAQKWISSGIDPDII